MAPQGVILLLENVRDMNYCCVVVFVLLRCDCCECEIDEYHIVNSRDFGGDPRSNNKAQFYAQQDERTDI